MVLRFGTSHLGFIFNTKCQHRVLYRSENYFVEEVVLKGRKDIRLQILATRAGCLRKNML